MNDLIEAAFTVRLSPYAFAKKLSELRGCYVREQMVYGYVAKGYIAHVDVDGRKMIEVDEMIRFATKYLTKNSPELFVEV